MRIGIFVCLVIMLVTAGCVFSENSVKTEEQVVHAFPRSDVQAEEQATQSQRGTYRQEMASLICKLKDYAEAKRGGDFFLIANGGGGLMEVNEFFTQADFNNLAQHLDGVMIESVHYGWDMEMDNDTPVEDRWEAYRLLGRAKRAGIVPMVLDYCEDPANVTRAYRGDKDRGFLGWASASRELDMLPTEAPRYDNDSSVASLAEAQNYIALLNPEAFKSRESYISALAASNYDVIIIDAYYDDTMLTPAEVARLQKKPLGGKRLVIAYMSVGETETYRPYWQEAWNDNPPSWVWVANEYWENNYRVKYWDPEWQRILMGSKDSYLDQILAAGFDGAFLDVIDAFYTFEEEGGY